MTSRRAKLGYLLPLILGGFLCAAAPLMSDYYRNIFILVFLWGFLGIGWNVLGGYAGQHSLGQGLYMGIGAYFTVFFLNRFNLTPWLGMIIAISISALVAWFIAWVVCRYHVAGAYFSLVTIAFTEAAVYIVSNVQAFGGASGMQEEIRSGLLWMQSGRTLPYFFVGVGLIMAGVLYCEYYSRQRFFYYLRAVRENEGVAEALGVDTLREKINASVISGVFGALGGVFYVQYFLFVSPRGVFGVGVSIQILLFAILGGLGTVWGPVVGAAVLVPVAELTRTHLSGAFAGSDLLIYGAVMVLTMLFMPYGILGLAKRIVHRYRRKSDSGGDASEAVPAGGEAA